MTAEERAKKKEWEDFLNDTRNATPEEPCLNESERVKKLAYLEAHPIEWIRFFFPGYAKYPFAPFHTKAIRRIINNDEWFEVLSWSRELAKSTVVMFCVLYLILTGRKKNVVLASATILSAEKLLSPYRAILEKNARIKQFYGEQMVLGEWTSTAFKCKCGASFMAIGAGSAPRGSRNEAIRPDVLLLDDFDTDEDCRNPETLKKKWEWWEKALYPTRSISEPTLIVFCGNIIAKDCCIVRAGKMADHWDIVNIRDKEGRSTWPEKNTEEHIERVLSKMSAKSAQGEYFNNPVSEGTIFKNLTFGKVPPLRKFKFIVVYGDPSQSSKTQKKNSFKAVFAVGKYKKKYYVIKGFLKQETSTNFIQWYFELAKYLGNCVPVYYWMENNSLQDPFFEEVFQPKMREARKTNHLDIYINGDDKKKTDKATRIEARLEPINRLGYLIFNDEEKNDPNMKELAEQFQLFEMNMPYPADGPDCIEGAIRKIQDKIQEDEPIDTITYHDLKEQDINRY